MRERLIELLDEVHHTHLGREYIERLGTIADYLLANGVIVPPCKVGQPVYYISDSPINLSVQANTIYEAHIARIVTTEYGTTLVVQIHNAYGVTEIPSIDDVGKTVFLTKEEAEQALQQRKEDESNG